MKNSKFKLQKPKGRILVLLVLLAMLSSCSEVETSPGTSDEANAEAATGERWYGSSQVQAGAIVFAQNCAQCHGDEAQGLIDNWRQRLQDGSFPPPPLDGSAHTWHHPRSVLLQVIDDGGVSLGGQMPAFANVLEHEEKLAAIAFFQNFWSDEIYQQWARMDGGN